MPDPTPEERAAAQKFAADHTNPNLADLKAALDTAYGDAWQAGAIAGTQQTGATIVAGLEGVTVPTTAAGWSTFWNNWQPGNAPAGDLLTAGGLTDLLASSNVTSKGIADTTMDRFGSILADGVSNGQSIDAIADRLNDYLQDPARAFQIANTETARAVSAASMNQYGVAGVTEVDWLVSPDACDVCQDYADNGPYALADFPDLPAHPGCRCSPSPRDPGAVADIPGATGSDIADLAASAVEDTGADALEDTATDVGEDLADDADTAGSIQDETADADAEPEDDSDKPIAERDLTKLSDDDVAALYSEATTEADLQAVGDELDRRDAVDDAAKKDAEKKAAAKVKRDAKTAAANQAKSDALDAAIAGGQDAQDAYSDIYGVSIEQQNRDTAISMLRGNGYKGVNFDQLSRAGFRDQLDRLYDAAEDATNGAMLNPAAERAGASTRQLFSGTEAFARKNASEELLDYWEANGRLTLENYRAGLLGGQIQKAEYFR